MIIILQVEGILNICFKNNVLWHFSDRFRKL